MTNYTKSKKETLTSQLWGSFVEFIILRRLIPPISIAKVVKFAI